MQHRKEVDVHPAAWCAVETSLLDLFAREQNLSVEALLGLGAPQQRYQYTAVLGNSDPVVFEKRVAMYLQYGFSDFKVKIEGSLEKDQSKLEQLVQAYGDTHKDDPRIRLDANNLWEGEADSAISFIEQLNLPILGIEEPVEPANPEALSQISTALNTAAILDESLCRLNQLTEYDNLSGKYIANIKVSRVGGVVRALELVHALNARQWPIIIGAHVGETSVLTRAAMCVAQATGNALVAQEGAFGTRLLEYDKVTPSLMFGKGGIIDLSATYSFQTNESTIHVEPSTWDVGWGVNQIR